MTTSTKAPRTCKAPATAHAVPQIIALATQDEDLGMVDAPTAQEEAQAVADEAGSTVYLRDPTTDEVLGSATPAQAEGEAPTRDFKAEIAPMKARHREELDRIVAEMKAAKPARVVKAVATRAQRAAVDGPKAPTGKTAELIALALRPEGVTPQELNEVSQWKGAPWRWTFSNPKGTGWAQRHGYQFRAEKGEDKRVRYFLTAE
jgi:hypothetical protein